MNLPFFIARRYLFSKNNRNAINIISAISVTVVALATAALVIVLSSINGFAKLINSQIAVYAPDLLLYSTQGKTFVLDEKFVSDLKKHDGVSDIVKVLEDNVLIKAEDRQKFCRLKGITENYEKNTGMSKRLLEGYFLVKEGGYSECVIGVGIAYELGISVKSQTPFSIWIPNRKYVSVANPMQSFNSTSIYPSGIVTVDNYIDESFIFASIKTARRLMMREDNEYSAIEIFTEDDTDVFALKKELQKLIPENTELKTVYEQFDIYRVMKIERIAAFLVMLFIIIVASFSIIGSLTMLIIEKKDDIDTLLSMGADLSLVKKIFLIEGWLISFFGAFLGVIIGGIISFLQQEYGIVGLPGSGNYVVPAYPVDIKFSDFIITFFSVSAVGFFIALYPLINLGKRLLVLK